MDVVDPSASGLETAVALETDGTAHLLYRGSCPTLGLCHTDNTGGAFASDLVEDDSWGERMNSLALDIDASAGLHAAYLRSGAVQYANRPSGGAWVVSRVSRASFIDQTRQVSLALDASGRPHIAHPFYWRGAESHEDGAGGWVTTEVGAWLEYPTIRLDGAGMHHLAFQLRDQAWLGPRGWFQLAYAWQPAGAGWSIEATPEISTGERGTALALDAAGGAHLFFGRRGLWHVWFPGCP